MTAPELNTQQDRSYTAVLLGGSAWSTIQTLLSKGSTLSAGLVFARLLPPADYATSSLALTFAGIVAIVAPSALSDLVVSEVARRGAHVGRYWGSSVASGVIMAALVLALIPIASHLYPHDGTYVWLFLLLSCRCIFEAIGIVPFSQLRLQLRFRAISVIETSSVILGTTVGLVAAVWLRSPCTLVLPLVAAAAFRAVFLLAAVRRGGVLDQSATPAGFQASWLVAGSGQYVHSLLCRLDVLFIGWLCSVDVLGYFSFAFAFAFQAQSALVAQFGAMLQPVLASFDNDRERQSAAHARVCRMMVAVVIPIACIQSTIAIQLFRLLFSERWVVAVPLFLMMNLQMVFSINAASVMALIKARGQFVWFLCWQLGHLLMTAGLFYAGSRVSQEWLDGIAMAGFGDRARDFGYPLAFIACNAVLWGASVRFARSQILDEPWQIVDLKQSVVNWAISLGSCVLLGLSSQAVATRLSVPIADAICVLLLAPIFLSLSLYLACRADQQLSQDFSLLIITVRRRIHRLFVSTAA